MTTEPGSETLPTETPKRILLVSAQMGEGHNAAARALVETMREAWPDCVFDQVDAIEAGGSRFARWWRWFYEFQLGVVPWTYQVIYDGLAHSERAANWFKAPCEWYIGRRLEAAVSAHHYDAIISTYPFGSGGLAWLRRHGKLTTPIMTYTPAFYVHPTWAYPEIDLHFVMYDTAAEHARTERFDEQLRLGAPPVRGRFGQISRKEARASLGLPADPFVVLVTGGALGLGEMTSAVRALVELPDDVSVLAVCGRNQAMADELHALGADPAKLRILGYVDTMPELMAAANAVVTNGAGVTCLEALCTPRPVIAFEPLPGHGRASTMTMQSMNLALAANNVDELVAVVRRLLTDEALLRRMERAGQEFLRGKDLRLTVEEIRRFLVGGADQAALR